MEIFEQRCRSVLVLGTGSGTQGVVRGQEGQNRSEDDAEVELANQRAIRREENPVFGHLAVCGLPDGADEPLVCSAVSESKKRKVSTKTVHSTPSYL